MRKAAMKVHIGEELIKVEVTSLKEVQAQQSV
jgi:hypothetical protein